MSDRPEHIDHEEEQAARLTAFVLGELSEQERTQMEAHLDEGLYEKCGELERLSTATLKADRTASLPEPSAALRAAIESKLSSNDALVELRGSVLADKPRGRWWIVLSAGLLLFLCAVTFVNSRTDDLSRSVVLRYEIAELEQQNAALRAEAVRSSDRLAKDEATFHVELANIEDRQKKLAGEYTQLYRNQDGSVVTIKEVEDLRAEIRIAQQDRDEKFAIVAEGESQSRDKDLKLLVTPKIVLTDESEEQLAVNGTPTQYGGMINGPNQPSTKAYVASPNVQHYYATPPAADYIADAGVWRGSRTLGAQGVPAPNQLAAGPNARGAGTAVTNYGWMVQNQEAAEPARRYRGRLKNEVDFGVVHEEIIPRTEAVRFGTSGYGVIAAEQYSQIVENRFTSVSDEPLSTFSIDVDTASYANTRRFLTQNQMPPANAIRIEEFINYFSYDYPAPKEGEPFSVNMEVAQCPWQGAHQLVRIGLKGKEVPQQQRPASNIVFLLDVSGSMQDANKLPLLKQAMKLLTDQLTESDRVSVATYAGNAGLALDTTNGESKQTIRDAIDALKANGSTNGSAGIQLAYEKATESFLKKGANRVILATDGDLNVGVTDDDALVELIKEKAASGVFLTVLGFGEGNLKDGKLEKLADNGNGMYAYIDSLREARKVLVEQISGSLVTIAKDVKIKVEFNPAEVAAYRLLGYENRLMSAPDFDNDAKDAGEIGAGHTVTALYEIVPAKIREQFASTVSSLKYQRTAVPTEPPKELTAAAETGELLTLFLRYKQPDANESTLSEFTVENKQRAFDDASSDFQFAAAVASFGMVLRNSEFRGNSSLADVEQIASSAIGKDPQGHRTEFLDLVRRSSTLQPKGR